MAAALHSRRCVRDYVVVSTVVVALVGACPRQRRRTQQHLARIFHRVHRGGGKQRPVAGGLGARHAAPARQAVRSSARRGDAMGGWCFCLVPIGLAIKQGLFL